jgi:hypothetical protein
VARKTPAPTPMGGLWVGIPPIAVSGTPAASGHFWATSAGGTGRPKDPRQGNVERKRQHPLAAGPPWGRAPTAAPPPGRGGRGTRATPAAPHSRLPGPRHVAHHRPEWRRPTNVWRRVTSPAT